MSKVPLLLSESLKWLPPSTTFKQIKKSHCVRFSIDNRGHLSITAPLQLSLDLVLEAVCKRRSWIEKHSTYDQPVNYDYYYPIHLPLRAFKENWFIRYFPTSKKQLTLKTEGMFLNFYGATHNILGCQLKLRQWIRERATVLLTQELEKISGITKLTYKKLQLRSQKTRWGSCTTEKSITLNDKLLFLPYSWVRYICIHELCHTKYMNHSQDFWRLVASCDHNYKKHKKALLHGNSYIPGWL